MKTIPVCLIVASFLAPVMSTAQPEKGSRGNPQRGGEGQRRGEGRFMDAWKAADTDHDGILSKEEFAMMPRLQSLPEEKRNSLFQRLDKNQDGTLERKELARVARPHEGQESYRPRLWELDMDKSGGVSFEEFKTDPIFMKLDPEKQKAVFHRLDTNKDGVISPKDRPEAPFRRDGKKPHGKRPGAGKPDRPGMEPRQFFRQLDQDGNGSVSFEEFRVGPAVRDLTEDQQEDRFEALDKNQDLMITPEELPSSPPPRGEQKRKKAPKGKPRQAD